MTDIEIVKKEACKEFVKRLKVYQRKMFSSDWLGESWDQAVKIEDVNNVLNEMFEDGTKNTCKDCRDCLHYGACNGWTELDEFANKNCENYANHSEWIHLQCKVGDKIFSIDNMIMFSDTYNGEHIASFLIYNDGVCFETDNNLFRRITEIGETVFFTREEAEKALERTKEND